MTALPAHLSRPQRDSSPNWVTVDQAARLTGKSVRHWRYLAIKLADRGLARKQDSDAGGRPAWFIDRSVDSRLSRTPDSGTRDQRQRQPLLARYPKTFVDRAYRKAYWLLQWRQRCGFPRSAGQTDRTVAAALVAEAKSIDGDDFPISVRSLQTWRKAYNTLDSDGTILGVEALVPQYTEVPLASRSPDAIAYFYGLWHTQAEHTAKTCHDATLERAADNGWHWPTSYAATLKWLARHDDKAVSCLQREGPAKYSQKYMDHIEIDKTGLQPGELYEADHSQLDFWCSDGQTQFRPWLTSILDCRSRVVVGWRIGTSPNQDSIVAAMTMAFRDRAIPSKFHVDQGKDFTSALIVGFTKKEHRAHRRTLGPKWREVLRSQYDTLWQGILGELGIQIIEAITYQPWSKGQKEVSYRYFHNHFCKSFATYTGRSPEKRPKCSAQMRRGHQQRQAGDQLTMVDETHVPTLDQVRSEFADQLTIYHATSHSGQGMDQRTPDTVWATAETMRQAQSDELLSLMQARGIYRVGKNGVRFQVGGSPQGYGAACGPLQRYKGRDVFATLDPEDCSRCHAYTADRKQLIATLDANEQIPYGTSVDQLREVIADINRGRKVMRQAESSAPQRLRSASQELRARRGRRAAQLRQTGTDDVKPLPDIAPVRTGFEGVSKPRCERPVAPPTPDPLRRAMQRMADSSGDTAKGVPPLPSPWAKMKSFVEDDDG